MADTNTYNSRRLLNRTGAVVAIAQILLFAGTICILCFTEIPKDNSNVLLVLLGNLASNVTSIVQWFFGGSLQGMRKAPEAGTATMTATVSASTEPEPKP